MDSIEQDDRSGENREKPWAPGLIPATQEQNPRPSGPWARHWLWIPLLAGGMAIAWLFPRKPSWQRVEPGRAADAQGQGGPGRRDRGQALARLRQAIIGSNKQEISQIFGLPRGVADQPNRVEVNRPAFWEAGMWYYPLRREEQSAMAITFDNGIAAAVQFIASPRKIKTPSHRYPV